MRVHNLHAALRDFLCGTIFLQQDFRIEIHLSA
jgi:hypothetical protein